VYIWSAAHHYHTLPFCDSRYVFCHHNTATLMKNLFTMAVYHIACFKSLHLQGKVQVYIIQSMNACHTNFHWSHLKLPLWMTSVAILYMLFICLIQQWTYTLVLIKNFVSHNIRNYMLWPKWNILVLIFKALAILKAFNIWGTQHLFLLGGSLPTSYSDRGSAILTKLMISCPHMYCSYTGYK